MIVIAKYSGLDINTLQLLGAGTQGKVYKIDSERCIKIFKKRHVCADEIETLAMAQINSHFPKLYTFGENYIVREYIKGIELDKFLSTNPLNENISQGIIELYESMNSVGYRRLDAAPFHIFITTSNKIKLIDTARAMKKKVIYPALIIKCLDDFGYKKEFLNYVKCNKPELYEKWLKSKQ